MRYLICKSNNIRFGSTKEIRSKLRFLQQQQITPNSFHIFLYLCCVHELFYRQYHKYISCNYFKFAWQFMFDLYKLLDLLISFYFSHSISVCIPFSIAFIIIKRTSKIHIIYDFNKKNMLIECSERKWNPTVIKNTYVTEIWTHLYS